MVKNSTPSKPAVSHHWLRSRIKSLGKTQNALAVCLGYSAGQVSRMLRGGQELPLRQVVALAAFVEMDPAELFARMAGLAAASDRPPSRVIPVLHDYGGNTVALVHFRAAASSDDREAEISRAELDGEKALAMGLDLALLGRRLIERERSATFAAGG
jgi:transcriptional regulator with XRE-family HTH domain